MTDILENMMQKCKAAGYTPTENIEKVARAKTKMFGESEWHRHPGHKHEERHDDVPKGKTFPRNVVELDHERIVPIGIDRSDQGDKDRVEKNK